jgi:hypothetical protein
MESVGTRGCGGGQRLSLVEFLLARIEEDETVALGYLTPDDVGSTSPVVRQVMERALDWCQARRRLVAEHATAPHGRACATLRLLAAGHHDHPDHPRTRWAG